MRTTVIVLLAGLMVILLGSAAIATNLLANGSFEDGPYGDFVSPNFAPAGWQHPWTQEWQYWQGVYDSTWKRTTDFGAQGFHNCNWPNWPDPASPAVDGSYFLGHWFPPQSNIHCEFDNVHMDGRSSYIYQTVTGLTPGKTYYFSSYFATQHPHTWPLFRLVALPRVYDDQTGTFDPEFNPVYPIDTLGAGRAAAPAEEESETYPFYRSHWAGSDERWSKLTGKVTLDESQNSVTLFVAYIMSTNNISEPQYVQADKVRLSEFQELEITDVEITEYSTNSVKIEWNVRDGGALIYSLTGAQCYVEYGATSGYGSTKAATATAAPNPGANDWCDKRPGHYEATITGLTQGQTYHFRVVVEGGQHSAVPPYQCPRESYPDPVPFSRLYQGAQTANSTWNMLPLLTITGPEATNITQNSATITWTTNAAADSKVLYGMFGVIDTTTSTNGSLTTSHSVTLTGLQPSTAYDYKVQSAAPGYNLTTSAVKTFTTALGPDIMNGSFEFRGKTGGNPNYWTQVPVVGTGWTYASGEWAIQAQDAHWYFGAIANGNGHFDSPCRYQQIATVPGQVVSLYAWSYAAGQAVGPNCDVGALHRFGENNNMIGIDPSGAKPNRFGVVPNTTIWSVPLGSTDFGKYMNARCGANAVWRRLGVCTIATGTTTTVYLRMNSWYDNAWVINMFDNVYVAPPTAVHSVGELKSQPFQTNVNLTQPAQGGYVVTYVAENNPSTDENEGMPYFYIQDTDGGPGIKVTLDQNVAFPAWLAPGKKVNIIGTLDWGVFFNYTHNKNYAQQLRMNKPAGEPVLRAIKIDDAGSGEVPAPVGVTNLSLGGGSSTDGFFSNAGVAGGAGACNVGMRVRTWGKIVEMDYDGMGQVYMVIDDGSAIALPDQSKPKPSLVNQTQPGVYVPTFSYSWPMLDDGSRSAQAGDYVVLTGVSGVRLDLDWDDEWGWPDPQDSSITIPQAMKNMRAIKIESAQYMALPE